MKDLKLKKLFAIFKKLPNGYGDFFDCFDAFEGFYDNFDDVVKRFDDNHFYCCVDCYVVDSYKANKNDLYLVCDVSLQINRLDDFAASIYGIANTKKDAEEILTYLYENINLEDVSLRVVKI